MGANGHGAEPDEVALLGFMWEVGSGELMGEHVRVLRISGAGLAYVVPFTQESAQRCGLALAGICIAPEYKGSG